MRPAHETPLGRSFCVMNKKYISIGAFILVLIGVFFGLNGVGNRATSSLTTPLSMETESTTTPPGVVLESKQAPVPQTTVETNTTISAAQTPPAQTPNVTLSVAGKSYTAFVPVGSSVLELMRALASKSDFSFTGREYPSLGFFVDSINGKKAERGSNWMLYFNGRLSNTGASQTTLKAGDSVEWKYEKSY